MTIDPKDVIAFITALAAAITAAAVAFKYRSDMMFLAKQLQQQNATSHAQAEQSSGDAAESLSKAAAALAPLYTDQLNKLQEKIGQLEKEVRLLNERLTDEIEKRIRAEAHVKLVDQQAAELSQRVRDQENTIVTLRQRLSELEAAKQQ